MDTSHGLMAIKGETPTLSDISLDIPIGSLVAVVGGTEEGKTSVVFAMLGELPPASDATDVTMRGTATYVSRVSWIFNATLQAFDADPTTAGSA